MRLKLLRFFFIIGFALVLLNACERDDICPPGTPTTPKLIIEFFDNEESLENKAVINLSYVAEGSNDTINLSTSGQGIDSIALPLNTNTNSSRFQLIRNTGNNQFENADEVLFTYQVDDAYINRSCGFKAIYSDLSASRIPEENPIIDNWIRSIIVEEFDVENENVTHIIIFH